MRANNTVYKWGLVDKRNTIVYTMRTREAVRIMRKAYPHTTIVKLPDVIAVTPKR